MKTFSRHRVPVGIAAVLATMVAGSAHAGDVMAAWGRNGATTPFSAVWDYATETWGGATAMSDVGAEPYWVMMKSCPTRDEKIAVTQCQAKDINIQVYDGCAWGAATEVCEDVEYDLSRNVDVAYEQVSGDALVVYWDKAAADMGYVTWDGTTLSGETNFGEPGDKRTRWVTLYPNPTSNEIIAVTRNDDAKTHAITWDGSAWEAGWTELGSTSKKKEYEGYALAYESLSGDALVVYDEDATTPRYQTWNGASWSGESDCPDIVKKAYYIRMAADPSSDEIICATLDEDHDINVFVWNGSGWGATLEIEDASDPREERSFDVAYEYGGNEALIVYYEKDQTELRYRTWNGSAWSAEQIGTDLVEKKKHFIQVQRSCCRLDEIFIAATDEGKDIELLRWDGSTMSGTTAIETDWGGDKATEMLMLAVPERPAIVTWQEVSP